MCDSPVMQFSLNLSDSLPKSSPMARRYCNLESELDFGDKFRSGILESEGSSSRLASRSLRSCKQNNSTFPYRFQLEQDVQRLRQELWQEMEVHAILENTLDHTAVASSRLSCLPHDTQELLSNLADLEVIVAKLEQETVSLHYKLSQERNERRLADYRSRHSHSQSLHCSLDDMKTPNAVDLSMIKRDTEVFAQQTPYCIVGKLAKEMPCTGFWNYPNQLSEEMVRCMKNIFISLADSATVTSKSSASESHFSPLSPHGHFSGSPMYSLSEFSTMSSWAQSPQTDLNCKGDLLGTENAFDPYRVRGKLNWADIGNYGFAVEVSRMSVGKKQLEYAAEALRRFRLLVEQLAKVNPIHLSCNEKLAFWINLYNALIMHAYLAYGVPRSDLKLFSLMQKAAYTVGGHFFSAAAIEYVILKMKPPVHRPQTALLLALHKLKVTEEQRKFSIESSEPLVAFSLSCGMYSSPAVRIYTAKNIRKELEEAQYDFIRASVGLSRKGRLLLPKMLHSFARGFIDDANLAVWISRFLPPHQASFVQQCISQRRQSFLGSRNCGILPFDFRFRYLFIPD